MGKGAAVRGIHAWGIVIACLLTLIGCMGAGTHGYIKAYRYGVTKPVLEEAIKKVIKTNAAVIKDSIKGYYNDDTSYTTLFIQSKSQEYSYTFQFYGDKQYWDSSQTSEVFIAYGYDKDRNGGSAGNGGVKWYDYNLKKELTQPFEEEFISKIDEELGIKHTEE
ncbi:MAG: hypothetical protein ABI169_14345 [Chitinophagaceae bacterium]